MKLAICLLFCLCAATAYGRIIFGLSGAKLIKIDSAAPRTILSTVTLSGLASGEVVLGIDFVAGKVSTTTVPGLYGLSNRGKVYIINTRTGAVGNGVAISTANGCPSSFTYPIGFDNNPTGSGLRVTTQNGGNYAVAYQTGTCTAQIAYTTGVTSVAYVNAYYGALSTTLYAYNPSTKMFGTVVPPTNGTKFTPLSSMTNVNPSFVAFASDSFYDVPSGTNKLHSVIPTSGKATLYDINLTTGVATSVGLFGTGSAVIRSIAISPALNTVPTPFYGLNVAAQQVFRFYLEDPSSVENVRSITGLTNSESLIGFDFRPSAPANYPLYAVGRNPNNAASLYTLNPDTGALTLVGALACPLDGSAPSVNFNPINGAGALRVISTSDSNFRITVATSACAVDVSINPASATIGAVAYANNLNGSTSTTLYAIDVSTGVSAIGTINPPNNGAYTAIGNLANGYPNTSPLPAYLARGAFDIIGVSDAYLGLGSGVDALFGSVELTTGRFFPILAPSITLDHVSAPIRA